MTKHKTLKVGIVQQACTADVEANKQNLKRNIADVAAQGAELVVLQELHNSLYFARLRVPIILIWQSLFPVLQPTFMAR